MECKKEENCNCNQMRKRKRLRKNESNFNKKIKFKKGDIALLSQLNINQDAKVISIDCPNPIFRRRLLDMGITKNALVKIKKISPMGDPVDILIRGYELCLRLNDLKNIKVEVL